MGYKVFTPTVLTSTDINSYLMKQTVMVFADATARGLALTAPDAGMVTYLTGTNALNTYNGSSWVVTGVTSAVAGTGISVSGATGAVTVTNTGVTSAVAGTGVGVSAATGAVTFSIGQSVATSVNPTFAGITSTGNITSSVIIAANTLLYADALRVRVGYYSGNALYSGIEGNKGYLLSGNTDGNNAIFLRCPVGMIYIGASGSDSVEIRNTGITVYGKIETSDYVAAGSTGVTDAGSVSTSNWFRATGNTGLYFQTHGGGFHMTDSTWVRTYNSKNLYTAGETRTNGSFSSDASRQRGSYGDITVGSNGRQGGWGGIEFVSPEDQTFMVYTDQYSGMYRNNTTWNWLWNYSTLQVPSDERYKREIEPLGLGMKFIEQLNPVSFLRVTEREDDDPDATEEGYYYGFTAQNVRDALDVCGETRDVKIHDIGGPNMGLVACVEGAVYDRQFIGISEFIAPVVEAIKELNVRLKTLEGV